MNINRIKGIVLFVFISLPLFAFALGGDTIVSSLHEMRVKDTLIYHLLDRAIIHEMNYKRGNNTFEIRINADKKPLEICVAYLNKEDKNIYRPKCCGYFIYKNNLFFVSGKYNHSFKKMKNECQFKFFRPNGLYMEAEETGWFYHYKNKQYILNYLFDSRIKRN